jgi:hypothetical protein
MTSGFTSTIQETTNSSLHRLSQASKTSKPKSGTSYLTRHSGATLALTPPDSRKLFPRNYPTPTLNSSKSKATRTASSSTPPISSSPTCSSQSFYSSPAVFSSSSFSTSKSPSSSASTPSGPTWPSFSWTVTSNSSLTSSPSSSATFSSLTSPTSFSPSGLLQHSLPCLSLPLVHTSFSGTCMVNWPSTSLTTPKTQI